MEPELCIRRIREYDDEDGVRLQLHGAVDASTNRLNNIGYDANGNALNDPTGGVYTYDLANRLASANGLEEYMYGADNKRLSKYVGGSYPNQTVYVYGAQGELLSLAAPSGAVTANNLYFGGRMIKQNTDTVATTSPDGNFVETDRTGSVRGGGFAIGNLFTSVLYLPYGEVLPTPNNTPAPSRSYHMICIYCTTCRFMRFKFS